MTDPSPRPDPPRMPATENDVMLAFTTFDTALGACGICWGAHGVVGVQLPGASAQDTAAAVRTEHPTATRTAPPPAISSVIARIQALLAGGNDDLADIALDLSACSEFERRAYALVRTIMPGHTMTYGEVATRLGDVGLSRAVGRAMGANPCPIIVPCHRVLGADGAIGGFSAPGGARTKRRMLLAEGVPERDGPALFSAGELFP